MIVAGLLLASLFLLPGLVAFATSVANGASRWPFPQGVAVALAAGIAASGLVAMSLGMIGVFSLANETIAVCLLSAGIAAAGRFRLAWPFTAAPLLSAAGFPLLAALASLTFLGRPFEMLIGGQDATTYVVAGIGLSKQGSLILRDRAAAKLGPEAQQILYPTTERDGATVVRRGEASKYAGFNYVDRERGLVRTQGFHLLPSLIAIFHSAFGLPGAFAANSFLAIAAVLAVAALGSFLVGDAAALLGATLLALDLVEVWAARYPVAEILLQLLLCGGLAAFLRGGRLGEALAGFLLGAAFFTKIDAALLVPPLAVLAVASVRRRREGAFWAVLLPVLLAAAIYWIGDHSDYITDAVRNFRSFQTKVVRHLWWNLPIVAALALAGGLLVWLLRRREDALASEGALRVAARALAIVLVFTALYAYFLRPYATGKLAGQAKTFVWLAWYVTPGVLFAAVAGLADFLWRRSRPRELFVVAVLLTPTLVFLHFTYVHLHHIYLTRRFVPATVPLVFLFFGWLLSRLSAAVPERRFLRGAGHAAVGLVAVAAVVAIVARSRHVYDHREYAGAAERLGRLAERLRASDLVLLVDGYSRDLLGPALEFVFDVDVASIKRARFASARPLIESWIDRGWRLTAIAQRADLAAVPGAEAFERVGRPTVAVPVLTATRNRFPDLFSRLRMEFIEYGAGTGSHPLFSTWRAREAEVCARIRAAGVRVIGGDPYLVRRVRSRCDGDSAPPGNFGFLFAAAELANADGVRFTRSDLDGMVLLSDLAPAAVAPISPRDWTASTKPPSPAPERAFDGQLDTRWRSPAPRRHGTSFTVAFPRPMDISWARIRMGRFATERASSLSVETSVDGHRWERVPQPVEGAAPVWRDDGAAVLSERGDADVWVNRRGVRFIRLVEGRSAPVSWSIAELELDGRASP